MILREMFSLQAAAAWANEDMRARTSANSMSRSGVWGCWFHYEPLTGCDDWRTILPPVLLFISRKTCYSIMRSIASISTHTT